MYKLHRNNNEKKTLECHYFSSYGDREKVRYKNHCNLGISNHFLIVHLHSHKLSIPSIKLCWGYFECQTTYFSVYYAQYQTLSNLNWLKFAELRKKLAMHLYCGSLKNISVSSSRWKGNNARLCLMKPEFHFQWKSSPNRHSGNDIVLQYM